MPILHTWLDFRGSERELKRCHTFEVLNAGNCSVVCTFLLLELRQAADGGGMNNLYHDLIPTKEERRETNTIIR